MVTWFVVISLVVLTEVNGEKPIVNCSNVDKAVPHSYLVKLKGDVSPDQVQNHIGKVGPKLPKKGPVPARGGPKMQHLENVNMLVLNNIEEDDIATVTSNPDLVESVECDLYVRYYQAPSWGLDRVLSSRKSLDGLWRYSSDNGGQGCRIFIADTGIQTNHTDFRGRIDYSNSAYMVGTSIQDDNGHGTHCAGIAAGSTYGIAPKATLHAVKVLDSAGSGTISGVVNGIDFITSRKMQNPKWPVIVSLSLGTSPSDTLDNAISRAIDYGVIFVVAAGNSAADACNYSPARVSNVMTVGAIDRNNDSRAFYSNYGSCVDLYAPGSSIVSTYIGPTTYGYASLTGTSMAAPHVSGIAALMMARNSSLIPRSRWGVSNLINSLMAASSPKMGPYSLPLAYYPCSPSQSCCVKGEMKTTCTSSYTDDSRNDYQNNEGSGSFDHPTGTPVAAIIASASVVGVLAIVAIFAVIIVVRKHELMQAEEEEGEEEVEKNVEMKDFI